MPGPGNIAENNHSLCPPEASLCLGKDTLNISLVTHGSLQRENTASGRIGKQDFTLQKASTQASMRESYGGI